MQIAKLFANGRSQAVRLPKEFRFEGEEVFIEKVGDTVVLRPAPKAWDAWNKAFALFGPDLDIEREQPKDQQIRPELDDL